MKTIIGECRGCKDRVLEKLENAKKALNMITLDDLQPKNRFNVDIPYIKKRIIDALEYIEEAQKELKPNVKDHCNCSWDYVTGGSPNYFCGKCGQPMRK